MSEPKPANPLVIVLLIVGIIGALGFTLWRTLAPPRSAPSPASTTADTRSPTLPEAAPAAPTQPATPDQGAKTGQAGQALVGENVALGVNPFGRSVRRTATRPAAPAAPSAPAGQPQNGRLPTPLLVSQDRATRAAALKALTSSDSTLPAPPTGAATSAKPMPVAVEPELAGTMLGGRPTAVFKAEKTLLMVPEGGVYMGWRVMKVGHSEATVWNGGVQLKLRVGMPSTPVAQTAEAPRPASVGYAASNFVIVHHKSRPAPTRHDLVYGRLEDPIQYGSDEAAEAAPPPDGPPAAGEPMSDDTNIAEPPPTTGDPPAGP